MALRSLGEASIREIATSIDRSPETVHYHVRELEKCGLVRIKSKRPWRRKPEAVYESSAASYRLPDLKKSPELAQITRETVSSGLRQVIRGHRAASKKAEIQPELLSFMHVVRASLKLSPEGVKRLFARIDEAVDLAKQEKLENGSRIQLSSVVFPELRNQSK